MIMNGPHPLLHRRILVPIGSLLVLVLVFAAIILHTALAGRPTDAASTAAPTVLPSSHIVDQVPAYAQHAPLSCEYAATSAITAHYNNPIPEATFINEVGFNPDPDKGFRGRIDGQWGGTDDYGVYPGPILDVLKRHGFPNSYRFDGDVALLRDAIAHDHPVVAWIVGTYRDEPRYQETRDGDTYPLVPYEHAVTVYGYDDRGVWLLDVGDAVKEHVAWDTFTNAWMQLDGMALVPMP
jgi:uncharacterized protein YvpB